MEDREAARALVSRDREKDSKYHHGGQWFFIACLECSDPGVSIGGAVGDDQISVATIQLVGVIRGRVGLLHLTVNGHVVEVHVLTICSGHRQRFAVHCPIGARGRLATWVGFTVAFFYENETKRSRLEFVRLTRDSRKQNGRFGSRNRVLVETKRKPNGSVVKEGGSLFRSFPTRGS